MSALKENTVEGKAKQKKKKKKKALYAKISLPRVGGENEFVHYFK